MRNKKGTSRLTRRRMRCDTMRARKQMLYLAPMAKNCRFPRRLRPFVRSLTPWISCPFKCARPLRKGQRKREREREREWNPILLPSLLLSFFSLSCPHNVASTFSLHSHVRSPRTRGGREEGRERWAAYCDAFAHHIFRSADLPRQARVTGGRKTPFHAARIGGGRGYTPYLWQGTRAIQTCH